MVTALEIEKTSTLSMHEFMEKFAVQLEQKVENILQPIYKVQDIYDDFGSRVEPRAVQREVVKALTMGYRTGMQSIFLVGEPGVGKTFMGIWTSKSVRAKRTLVMCPPHLLSQWRDEIKAAYPASRVAVIPDQKLRDMGISNMQTLQSIHKTRSADYVVISREAIKTDFPTINQTIRRLTISQDGPVRRICCPQCFEPLDYDTLEAMARKKTFCLNCGSALFSYVRGKHHGRPSLAKYIQRKMKGFFDFIIFDEVHELSAGESAQGAVLGKLGRTCRTLAMTGTLMGGYSSNLFHLLHRMNPRQMLQEGFRHNSRTEFAEKYGAIESVHEVEEKDNVRSIGKRRQKEVQRERPGLSPLVVGVFLLDKSVFIRLSDFAENLPVFNEHPVPCKLHPALKEGYEELARYKDDVRGANNPARVVSSALQAMLAYPDTHTAEAVLDDENGEVFALRQAPAVDIPLGETEKEKELLRICKEAKAQGRKVLVYTTQTNKRDIQPRLAKLLAMHGLRGTVMTRSVSTGKRDEWIKKRTPLIDDLLCHPKLVSTGMNLIPFTVIVFFDCGYSTYTLRQASRRSFRIVQTSDVIDVYYLYTAATAQQDCLSLMAKKNEVSLMVEGEIVEGGLSSMADAGGSVLGDLAKVLNGKLRTENPLEVFARLNKLNNRDKPARRNGSGGDALPSNRGIASIPDQTRLYVPGELIEDKHGQFALF